MALYRPGGETVKNPLDEDPQVLKEQIRGLRRALALATMDIPALLRLRGFSIHSMQRGDDLLLPGAGHIERFYEMMRKYSFRLFLRDVIKHRRRFNAKDVTRYATAEATGDYIECILDIGLAERVGDAFRLTREIESFGETLEWFLAETFRREFGAEAVWGVKFKGKQAAGDYDLIAKADGTLLYMEVKSSPPKQVYPGEIAAFLDRVEDLRADISLFFMDTELRMKDKIVPMFEEELKKKLTNPPEAKRIQREIFRISERIFIINSKGGIAGNVEKVLRWYFRRHDPLTGPA
jgi:hypothetical protein